ncbi:hypothetical protein [Mitsuokella sp.]|uniref:hypothetical protein n=1 Tax=Mitsuokella sp. TaxID=2049034 RepID=UPI003D7D5A8C
MEDEKKTVPEEPAEAPKDAEKAEIAPSPAPAEQEELVKKEAEGPLIYVGPGFKDSQLSTYGIFADGVPQKYKGTIYEKLFVPPAKLNEARELIKKKGSYLRVFFEQAKAEHDAKSK